MRQNQRELGRVCVCSAEILFVLFALSACTKDLHQVVLQWTYPEKRVLLMAPQFDLREFGLNSESHVRDDWRRTAKAAATEQLRDLLAGRGIVLSISDWTSDPNEPSGSQRAVSARPSLESCIAEYFDRGGFSLPCDAVVRTRFSADYVLFLTVKNEFDVAGKSTSTCAQPFLRCGGNSASASLLDLRSGTPVWSNTIWAGADWRDEVSTKNAVQRLLADSPF